MVFLLLTTTKNIDNNVFVVNVFVVAVALVVVNVVMFLFLLSLM